MFFFLLKLIRQKKKTHNVACHVTKKLKSTNVTVTADCYKALRESPCRKLHLNASYMFNQLRICIYMFPVLVVALLTVTCKAKCFSIHLRFAWEPELLSELYRNVTITFWLVWKTKKMHTSCNVLYSWVFFAISQKMCMNFCPKFA